jgi:subfamily B ATP-binding cassette protein MsbA
MQLFLRFLRFFRPYRWRVSFALFLVFFTQAVGLISPKIYAVWINGLTSHVVAREGGTPKHDGKLSPLMTAVEQKARTTTGALQVLFAVIGVMVGIRVITMSVGYARGMTITLVAQRLLFDLRQRLFRHLQRLSLRYYETQHTGRIMSRVLYDVDVVQSILGGSLLHIVTDTITLSVVLVLILAMYPLLSIIAIAAMILYTTNYLVFRKKLRSAAADVQEQYSGIYSTLHERIAGAKIVKSFGREQSESRRFVGEIREQLGLNVRQSRLGILMGIGSEVITAGASIGVLLVGGWMIIVQQSLTIGDLIAFNMYMGMLYGPITTLIQSNDTIQRTLAAIERIFDTLDTLPDVQEKKDAVMLDPCEGRVEFRNVDFWYEPGHPVLQNISFAAEPGKMIALVGPSGGGKSTIVNLIPRFYDPTEGVILIDGHDLRELKLISLRQHIGIVLQETFLFSGTIRDNIKYGKSKATDEEIMRAAIAANAHDFIMEFPEGYETEIGERGVGLSGGQRQRISIARAILRNPKILILDEATSSLDSEAEALIQEALDKLMADRTTFVIAHRLSTVMNADEILVIDGGKIVERGTHEELVKNDGGLYQRLCRVQFKQSEEILAGRPEEVEARRKAQKRGARVALAR